MTRPSAGSPFRQCF